MVAAINQCHKVDEVKEIRDKALALEHYARQAMNVQAEQRAIEVRIRAERRAGQLLAELEKGKGGQPKKNSGQAEPSSFRKVKREAKISDTQAKRWQQLAAMPHGDFEGKLQDPLIKPSTTGIIGSDKPKQATDRALWLWGQLRDFERREVFTSDINDVVKEMSEALQGDIRRLVPQIIDWLQGLNGS